MERPSSFCSRVVLKIFLTAGGAGESAARPRSAVNIILQQSVSAFVLDIFPGLS